MWTLDRLANWKTDNISQVVASVLSFVLCVGLLLPNGKHIATKLWDTHACHIYSYTYEYECEYSCYVFMDSRLS